MMVSDSKVELEDLGDFNAVTLFSTHLPFI